MRLSDDIRKCVVFFGTPSPGVDNELEPWGTGFLVATSDTRTIYLVTARHVIQDKLDCPFAVRFNNKEGGSQNRYYDDADWQFHPTDETVDVAVMEIEPPEWADWMPLGQKHMIMDDFKFSSKDIGPGDLVYTVGLWHILPGRKRNKPFVHVGHIGMVPQDDKLGVKDWMPGKIDEPVEVEAYLTEGEPLSGASGSPVFVRRSLRLGKGLFKEDPNAKTWVYGSVWLLGLMTDSYIERTTLQNLGEKEIPRGINIVVPSMKINETLNQDFLKERRAAKKRASRGNPLPKKIVAETSALDSHSIDEKPKHRENFNSLVGKVARKQKQGD